MKARALAGTLWLVLLCDCGLDSCNPPPSIPSGCWSHAGSSVDDVSCVGSSEAEPNGDLVAANVVPDASCDSMQFIEGAVSNDIDVLRANGSFCPKSPKISATLTTDPDDVRLCVFTMCQNGKTGLTACSGTTSPAGQTPVANHMPEGALGCCRVGQGSVELDVNCDSQYAPFGKKPLWHTFFVVDRVRDSTCTSYKIGYQF